MPTIGTKHGAFSPYKGHEAMCKCTQPMIGGKGKIGIGGKSTKEGAKSPMGSGGRSHGKRGYQASKVAKHK